MRRAVKLGNEDFGGAAVDEEREMSLAVNQQRRRREGWRQGMRWMVNSRDGAERVKDAKQEGSRRWFIVE